MDAYFKYTRVLTQEKPQSVREMTEKATSPLENGHAVDIPSTSRILSLWGATVLVFLGFGETHFASANSDKEHSSNLSAFWERASPGPSFSCALYVH